MAHGETDGPWRVDPGRPIVSVMSLHAQSLECCAGCWREIRALTNGYHCRPSNTQWDEWPKLEIRLDGTGLARCDALPPSKLKEIVCVGFKQCQNTATKTNLTHVNCL